MRALSLALVLLLSGCLTSTYVVPTPELQRLAAVAPEERGKQVRVVQGYAGADQPPEAPHVGAGVGVIVAPVPGYNAYPYGPYGYFRPSTKSMKEEAKAWIALAAILGALGSLALAFGGEDPVDPVLSFVPPMLTLAAAGLVARRGLARRRTRRRTAG